MSRSISVMILPDELMVEILTRLPGKQLGRCKCVCKSWQSMIGSPAFKDVYQRRAPNLILYWVDDPWKTRDGLCFSLRCFSATLGRLEESTEEFSFLSHLKSKYFCKYFTRVVNGLICFLENGYLFNVYNVFTGQKMSLPTPIHYITNPQKMSLPTPINYITNPISVFHLGYHPVTRMYKLLRLICTRNEHHPMQVEIMTLRPSTTLSTWRKLDNDECGIRDFHTGFQKTVSLLTSNGLLWFLSGLESLFSFDLNKEKFEFIKVPVNFRGEIGQDKFYFIQSMGRPAIWVMPISDDPCCLILLVLEDCKDNIWNKHSAHFPEELGEVNKSVVDAGNLPTGEILFMNVEANDQDRYMSLYSYNHHTNEFDRLQVGQFHDKPLAFVRGSQNHCRAEDIGAKVSCLHDNKYLYLPLDDVLESA